MDKIQQEFETWMESNGKLAMKEENGEYSFQHTRFAFEAWKSSRAELCVELPEPWLENRDMVCGFDEIKDQLDKAGVSYK